MILRIPIFTLMASCKSCCLKNGTDTDQLHRRVVYGRKPGVKPRVQVIASDVEAFVE